MNPIDRETLSVKKKTQKQMSCFVVACRSSARFADLWTQETACFRSSIAAAPSSCEVQVKIKGKLPELFMPTSKILHLKVSSLEWAPHVCFT